MSDWINQRSPKVAFVLEGIEILGLNIEELTDLVGDLATRLGYNLEADVSDYEEKKNSPAVQELERRWQQVREIVESGLDDMPAISVMVIDSDGSPRQIYL